MFEFFAVKRELGQLRDDLEKLKREFRGIEQEWLDTLDRNKAIMARIVKRQQRIEAAPENEESEPVADNGPDLSKMDPLSRRIWARRLQRVLPR